MEWKRRTVCKKGLHALTGANVYISPSGSRMCRACRKAARPSPIGSRIVSYNFPRIKYCSKGHAVISPNIKIRSDAVVCRRCSNDYHNKAQASGPIRPALLERIRCAIEDEGAGLGALEGRIGGRKVGPRIIRVVRFRNWAQRHAKPLLKQAIANGAKRYEAARVRSIVTAPAIIRAADDIMDIITAAVPRYHSKDVRDDAIQNIWLAVIERRLKRDEITSRAYKFVRAEYNINHNKYGPRSLDVPIWIDGKTTLLDTLTRGLWD